MKYIKFGFILICLLALAQGAMARPKSSRWSETHYSEDEREEKLEAVHAREANERNRRRAEEMNARAAERHGARAAKVKPVTAYEPEYEYTPVMYKILKGEPLMVGIWQSARNKRRDYDASVSAAFDSWFTHARLYIGNRSSEFPEVMRVLNRKVRVYVNYTVGKVKVLPPGDGLFINMFDTLEEVQKQCNCGNTCGGCMDPNGMVRIINMYKDDPEFQTTLEHELGHVFGLEDEYLFQKKMDATTHRSRKRAREKSRGGSIMDRSESVQCDDVDGLINLIDSWNECSSARAQNGWESVCGDGTIYKCGGDKFYDTVAEARTTRKRRK